MKKIIITESQLRAISHDELFFSTFSAAVQHARKKAEDRGYEIDEDDWFREVTTGPGKPREGQTTRMTIGIIKNGKPQRKALQIVVYNMGNDIQNNYELVHYIN
jgi:hypothetical protein